MPLSQISVGAVITPEGRLELDDRAAFSGLMREMRRGPVTVEIGISHPKHSQKARGYYRGCVLKLIAEHTGHTVNELHDFFKRKFLEPKIREVLGQRIEVWTTTEDDSQEFFDYVELIREFARTDLDIDTPDPDKRWKERLQREAERRQEAA